METETNLIHGELAYKVVGLAMKVHRELGFGFLEKVYENALVLLLRNENIPVEQQAALKVRFLGETVGEYYADLMVDGAVLIELKACERISQAHRAQTLNYLKATGLRLGLIINFGKASLEYERLVR